MDKSRENREIRKKCRKKITIFDKFFDFSDITFDKINKFVDKSKFMSTNFTQDSATCAENLSQVCKIIGMIILPDSGLLHWLPRPAKSTQKCRDILFAHVSIFTGRPNPRIRSPWRIIRIRLILIRPDQFGDRNFTQRPDLRISPISNFQSQFPCFFQKGLKKF